MAASGELQQSLLQKKTKLTRLQNEKEQALQQITKHNKVFTQLVPAGPLALKATAKVPAQAPDAENKADAAKKHIKHNTQRVIDLVSTIVRLEQEVARLEQQLYAADNPRQKKKERQNPKPAKPTANKAVEQVTVLFLAANALKNAPLQLDAEVRNIQENIRKSEYRDAIDFVTRWATQPLDILQAINEVKPQIVHFSGHGAENDGLVLQGEDGKPAIVPLAAVVQVMLSASDMIRLVFFNVCFSDDEAKAVVSYVEAAVGMQRAISDEAARIFASQFYSALGFGKSLKNAFEQAKAALMLTGIAEENTPFLYVKEGFDPAQLVLVQA